MRRRHLHRPFASLALIAMLLLSVLPTVGRLAGEGALAAAHGHAAAAAAHGSGVDHMAHMAHAVHADHGRPSMPPVPPPHDGHGSHDCPYCPLLTGLASSPVPPGMPASTDAAGTVPSVQVASVPLALRTSSLGSRGPPALGA
ncbi:MAG: DUF2946 family protein [Luteimonas sp.]